MSQTATQYIHALKNKLKDVELAQAVQNLENLYVKKLWYQLSVAVRQLVNNEAFAKQVNLKEFFDNFVKDFQHRINQLQLVEIALPVARQVFVKDQKAAYAFVESVRKDVEKDPLAAVRIATGDMELHLSNRTSDGKCKDLDIVKAKLEEAHAALDAINGVTAVHSPFYKVSSEYLREVCNYAAYYREALRYLGCSDTAKFSVVEKKRLAVTIGFAALLGEDIYNFGELLAHPIIEVLKESNHHWLLNVLVAVNSGDLPEFRKYEAKINEWPDLMRNKDAIERKTRLLCIMEIAMARPSRGRQITFNEIAKKALVDVSQVEYLVMKALSKHLVNGTIDQVEATVTISWVQPRVLTSTQIGNLADRVGGWRGQVETMGTLVQTNAKEIVLKA